MNSTTQQHDKVYILQKDTPDAVAGTRLVFDGGGNYDYTTNSNECGWYKISYVENNPEWFLPEQPKEDENINFESDLWRVADIISRIWFYGDMKIETRNEKILYDLLNKLGLYPTTEEKILMRPPVDDESPKYNEAIHPKQPEQKPTIRVTQLSHETELPNGSHKYSFVITERIGSGVDMARVMMAVEDVLNGKEEVDILSLKQTQESWIEVVDLLKNEFGLEDYKWDLPISPCKRILKFIADTLYTEKELLEAEKKARLDGWCTGKYGTYETFTQYIEALEEKNSKNQNK